MFRLKRGFWNLPGTPSIDLIKIFCLILRVCCFIFSITNWYMMCCLSGNQQYPDKSWRFCISETVRKFSISTCELHACRLREGLGGFVPLHRPIVHRFQLKILLYCNFMCSPVVCIEQKYAQCSWIYGANKKKTRTQTFKMTREIRVFKVFTIVWLSWVSLCMYDHIRIFFSRKLHILGFSPHPHGQNISFRPSPRFQSRYIHDWLNY